MSESESVIATPAADTERLDRRISAVAETLARLITDSKVDCHAPCNTCLYGPQRAENRELDQLPLLIFGLATEVEQLIRRKNPPRTSAIATVAALAVAAASIIFAGAEACAFQEWHLGVADLVAGCLLAVWASLVQG